MTKNHILIQSAALGFLLFISSPAKAAAVDQVLVQYFNKLYSSASPKCTVDPAAKTKILSALEEKCLIRTVTDNGSFISGVKSACSEASVKTSVDAQVDAICVNTAVQVNQAGIEKQAAIQQDAAAKKAAGATDSGNANSSRETLGQIAKGLQLYSSMANKDIVKGKKISADSSESAKGEKGVTGGSADTTAKTAAGSGKIEEIPSVGTSSIYGNSTGTATNNAIDKANEGIRKHNAELDAAQGGDKANSAKSPVASGEQTPDEQAAQATPVVGEAREAAKELPQQAQDAGADAVKDADPEATDPELQARHQKSQAEDSALKQQLESFRTKLNATIKAFGPEAVADCTANDATRAKNYGTTTDNPKMEAECKAGTPQQILSCLDTNFAAAEKEAPVLDKDKKECSNTSAQAEKACSMVRSEKAQTVQKLMSVGATVLSKVTAASEACGTTSTLSKVAQGGMMLAQGFCTSAKFRCDFSCRDAEKTVQTMKKSIDAAAKCGASKLEAAKVQGQKIDQELMQLSQTLAQQLQPEKSIPTAKLQCEKHKADIALMGLSALGFLSAFQDAQECKKQLAAGGGTGAAGKGTSSLAGPQMTTAEYCSMPANAASLTCKCTSNPNADGCMGSLAKSGVNLGKVNAGAGVSAFASAGQNGLGSIDSLSKSPLSSDEPAPGANLSDAAREALGMGVAAGGGEMGGGSAAAGSSSSDAKKAKVKDEEEKSKYGFFSNLSNMMSGGKAPSQAANAAIRKFEQEQAIKRKIASDQVRAEISTASGKSNFDKIRNRYLQNAGSFEQ